jgi:hypothetical protein
MHEDSRRESSAWFKCKSSERERTTHLQHEVWGVKGTYVQVCDALRASVAQGSHELFWIELRWPPRGTGSRSRKNSKLVNLKFVKLKKFKTKSLKIDRKFVFAKIELDIVCCRRFVFFSQEGKTFASSSLCSIRNA